MEDGGAIQAAIEAATAAVTARDGLRARRDHAAGQQAEAEARLVRARLELADDREQVARLETFSLARIVATLRGSREQDLDRERAEQQAAHFRVAAAQSEVDHLVVVLRQLDDQLGTLRHVDLDLAGALTRKERWLIDGGLPGGERLAAIAAERGAARAERHECDEAVVAGRRAHGVLTEAAQALRKADGWSDYDTFWGGGAFSSGFKHDHMDHAAGLLQRASRDLATLDRELADIGRSSAATLQLDSWTRTFDVWFDNIFTDLKVRKQLKAAIDEVARARKAVATTVAEVDARSAELSVALGRLDLERDTLLRR